MLTTGVPDSKIPEYPSNGFIHHGFLVSMEKECLVAQYIRSETGTETMVAVFMYRIEGLGDVKKLWGLSCSNAEHPTLLHPADSSVLTSLSYNFAKSNVINAGTYSMNNFIFASSKLWKSNKG